MLLSFTSPFTVFRRYARMPAILASVLGFYATTTKRSLPPCHDSDHDSDSDYDDDTRMTKEIIADFLNGLTYQPPCTRRDSDLRGRVQAEISSWGLDVSTTFTDKMLSNACNMAECCYGHTSPEHTYFIALYTAFTFYSDDHVEDHPEVVGEFAHRFTMGKEQLDPVMERFAQHVRKAYDLWPLAGANLIVSGTLDSMTSVYLEKTTKMMPIIPKATRYPYFLRSKTGVGIPYAQFIFHKAFRDSITSYVQILPELDVFINLANDILSFYKESLAGETDNYVHLRAAAEQKHPLQVLREVSAEVTQTVQVIEEAVSRDPPLAEIWQRFLQGYLEFHIRTPRYRLAELDFHTG